LIVVGNGLLGSHFRRLDACSDHVIFASGVANSRSTSVDEFNREAALLTNWLKKAHALVYFSTCSIDDPLLSATPYVLHKMAMEKLVLGSKSGLVIRVPQVVGNCDNRNTLINFLVDKIYHSEPFVLQAGAVRNLIDIDDLVSLTMFLIKEKYAPGCYSFAMPIDYEVSRIVSCIEKSLHVESLHTLKKGRAYSYPKSLFVEQAINNGVIRCGEDYLETIIAKFFSNPQWLELINGSPKEK
jgi:nucleoside-diphosphate-sugar epimerase